MPETPDITLEQAINNVALVVDQYRGTKQEHVLLEQSVSLIKNLIDDALKKSELIKN